MYSLDKPVSVIRNKIRQEFERHRYVQQLKTTDVLLYNSHAEFQVSVCILIMMISTQPKGAEQPLGLLRVRLTDKANRKR